MKKGQSEIIGLAIVVVLLIMALIFYATFKNDSQSDTELLRNSIRANNVLNAVLLVNIGNEQMKDKLNDCIKSNDCVNERKELENIFIKILDNKDYEFKAFEEDIEKFNITKGVCVNSVAANPARFPGNYRYEFRLCYS